MACSTRGGGRGGSGSNGAAELQFNCTHRGKQEHIISADDGGENNQPLKLSSLKFLINTTLSKVSVFEFSAPVFPSPFHLQHSHIQLLCSCRPAAACHSKSWPPPPALPRSATWPTACFAGPSCRVRPPVCLSAVQDAFEPNEFSV